MASIESVIAKLRGLDSTLVHALVGELADDALELVRNEFATGTDPYGVAWAPPTTRDNPPLEESLSLAGSFSAEVSGTTITIGSDQWYASIHQYGGRAVGRRPKGSAKIPRRPRRSQKGSKRYPRRQMLPEGKLGPIWEAKFKATVEAKWQAAWK
jgi:phage gpG-like protein